MLVDERKKELKPVLGNKMFFFFFNFRSRDESILNTFCV